MIVAVFSLQPSQSKIALNWFDILAYLYVNSKCHLGFIWKLFDIKNKQIFLVFGYPWFSLFLLGSFHLLENQLFSQWKWQLWDRLAIHASSHLFRSWISHLDWSQPSCLHHCKLWFTLPVFYFLFCWCEFDCLWNSPSAQQRRRILDWFNFQTGFGHSGIYWNCQDSSEILPFTGNS